MVTPLTHPWSLRRTSLGLTQLALANSLGVTRHMVIRLEQALFAEPPPLLLSKLALALEYDPGALLLEYHNYVKETRLHFRNKHHSFKVVFGVTRYLDEKHPLEFYRNSQELSRIGFCKGLCLHQDPINDYEKNRQRGLPAQLYEAAQYIGWDTEPLTLAVKDWRLTWH